MYHGGQHRVHAGAGAFGCFGGNSLGGRVGSKTPAINRETRLKRQRGGRLILGEYFRVFTIGPLDIVKTNMRRQLVLVLCLLALLGNASAMMVAFEIAIHDAELGPYMVYILIAAILSSCCILMLRRTVLREIEVSLAENRDAAPACDAVERAEGEE